MVGQYSYTEGYRLRLSGFDWENQQWFLCAQSEGNEKLLSQLLAAIRADCMP